MAYETKVILKSVARSIAASKNLKQAYAHVEDIANAEGVVLLPYDELKDKLDALESDT